MVVSSQRFATEADVSLLGARACSRRQLFGLLPRKDRVEHRVLGFFDRAVRVVDRERRVVFGDLGVPLSLCTVVLSPLALDVRVDDGDVLVPVALDVAPPVGDIALAGVGLLAQGLGLGLGRCARRLDVLLEIGLGLGLRSCRVVLRLLGPRCQLAQLI